MGPSLADELDAAMRGETTQRAIMGVVNESYRFFKKKLAKFSKEINKILATP